MILRIDNNVFNTHPNGRYSPTIRILSLMER